MNEIHSISEITYQDLADYLRICDTLTADDINTLKTLLTVAKAYVTQYTGQTIEDLDKMQDVIIVILILVQDMWDNRTLYVDSGNSNKVVESILNLHQVNLL